MTTQSARKGGTHLEVSHHDKAHGVGAARHQRAGVDPAAAAVFDNLSVAQEAHHHHCTGHNTRQQRVNGNSNGESAGQEE